MSVAAGDIDKWRQGTILHKSVLEERDSEPSLVGHVEDEDVLIVISQDCDLVNPSLEKEPYAEILLGRRMKGAPNGNFTLGKNPRRYHLPGKKDGSDIAFDVSVHDKARILREQLIGKSPDSSVTFESIEISALASWIARRYVRAAFPTEFNERLKSAESAIARALKQNGGPLTGVFFRLSSAEELPADQTYHVIIRGTVLRETYKNDKAMVAATTAIDAIEVAVAGCKGIEVDDSDVDSEDDFSMTDLRETFRWEAESLSYKEGDAESIAPR